ncbi:MAG: hypothetical protein ACR2PG_10930 [Hyphomicrobiaceae bacterium]
MVPFADQLSAQELIVIDRHTTGADRKPSALVYVNLIGSAIIRLARAGMTDDKIVSELSQRLNIPASVVQKEFEALKLTLTRASS